MLPQLPLPPPTYLRGAQLADTSMCSHSLKSLPNQWSLPKPPDVSHHAASNLLLDDPFQLLEALNFMS